MANLRLRPRMMNAFIEVDNEDDNDGPEDLPIAIPLVEQQLGGGTSSQHFFSLISILFWLNISPWDFDFDSCRQWIATRRIMLALLHSPIGCRPFCCICYVRIPPAIISYLELLDAIVCFSDAGIIQKKYCIAVQKQAELFCMKHVHTHLVATSSMRF